MTAISPYKAFVAKWKGCKKCPLHQIRDRVVLARGELPADILFIGESPGNSENVLGVPFVGPAGKLLNQIIAEAVPEGISYALTNLICCIPLGEDGVKVDEPDLVEIMACGERLREFVTLCQPRLIVAVGGLARDWIDPKRKGCVLPMLAENGIKTCSITHPAAILRATWAMRDLAVKKAIVTISNAVLDLEGAPCHSPIR